MYNQTLILIQCQDAVGLVANISIHWPNISLTSLPCGNMLMRRRTSFCPCCLQWSFPDQTQLTDSLANVLPPSAQIQVNPSNRKKIVVLVTKEHHCLADILVRQHFETWGAEVQAVIGNYDTLRSFTDKFEIPFHYISHEGISKEDFETQLIAQIKQYDFDYIILAKFMRILSPICCNIRK
ncbi:hypothetical protein KUH03_24630 [Sphingobacterium sp. E70]|nr:formyltransferase family protein [Sphingobacterium sp. E70]ULT22553.1 hypothetical protein KUH03_24630 [Sphingobacterium sp. E70]